MDIEHFIYKYGKLYIYIVCVCVCVCVCHGIHVTVNNSTNDNVVFFLFQIWK